MSAISRGEASARYKALLDHLAKNIGQQLPDAISFALVTFTRDGGKYAGYVSDAQRPMVVAALRAAADHLEGKKFFEGNSQIILPH